MIFFVALRPEFGSWPPLTGLRDHIGWTHHSSGREISSKHLSYIIKIHKSNDQDDGQSASEEKVCDMHNTEVPKTKK